MPLFSRKFYLTGIEFLFLGLLLGPNFLNLLDINTLKGLEPLMALVLGWIGLLFGFQFEMAKLRRFPRHFFQATFIEAALTFIYVIPAVFFMLSFLIRDNNQKLPAITLMMAAAAVCSAPTGIALLARDTISRRHDMIRLLRFMSSIDSGIALSILSFAYFFRHPIVADVFMTSRFTVELTIIVAALIFLLLLYNFFLAQRLNTDELSIAIVGMAILTSGAASMLHFSPLVINFIFGFALVNISMEKEKIFNLLMSIEKPLYLLLCVFLGASWTIINSWVLLMASGYFFFRMAAKFSGGILITWIIPKFKTQPKSIGFGLLDQGGLSLAIIFDFQQGFPWGISQTIVSVALFTIVINDLISTNLIHRLFREQAIRSDA